MQMMIVQFSDPNQAKPIAAAIETAAPAALIQHFQEVSKPVADEPVAGSIDPALVEQVVKIVRSAPRNIVWGLLYGDSSYQMSRGDARDSIRPDTIALSRRLKPVFPHLASPIDALVVRQREYFAEGGYKGIRYSPTPLGAAVRDALKAESDA